MQASITTIINNIHQVLGYAVLTGATIVKVPQILNVVRAGSAEGISAVSIELEVLGYCIHSSYGFLLELPFSTYGEALLLLAQTVVLLLLVNNYARAPVWRSAAVVAALAAAGASIVSGMMVVADIGGMYLADDRQGEPCADQNSLPSKQLDLCGSAGAANHHQLPGATTR